jgi:hypothetical protein
MGKLLSETQFNGDDVTTTNQPANEGGDTPAGSSPAQPTEPTGQEGQGTGEGQGADKSKDDAGLADHPRWKEREEDWKKRYNDQEVRHATAIAELQKQIQALMENVQPAKPAQSPPAEEKVEVPEWFAGDEEAFQSFSEWHNSRLEKLLEARASKETEQKTQESKRIEEATQYFNEQVAALESDKDLNPNGEKIDHNKLLKFVMDNDLVDSQGRWNYKAGYRMMRAQTTGKASEDAEERRKLAAVTAGKSRPEAPKESAVTTSEYFKTHKPW